MDLSVVVPTLNAREELAGCLDALTGYAGGVELIVVNGPSSDGTTGMVQDHDGVDVLIEVADRTINVARNAGIDRATGDTVAFVDHQLRVTERWQTAIGTALADADGATGPTGARRDGVGDDLRPESRTIAGREVTYFDPGNVAFTRDVLDELDGFDEYLAVGGARDLAHRFAANGYAMKWAGDMTAIGGLSADGGERDRDLHWKYRSLAYRMVKNYGVRPSVAWRLLAHAGSDALSGVRSVLGGDELPSWWLGTGRDVLTGIAGGAKDSVVARRRDRSPRRNPRGRSARADRAVTVYDWR